MDWLILTVIGIVFFAIAIHKQRKNSYLLINGKTTRAVVFKMERTHRDNLAYPVLRFTTEDKEWITTKIGLTYPGISQGDRFEVLYDPDDPKNVVIKNHFVLEIMPKLFMAIGLAFIVLSILGYLEML